MLDQPNADLILEEVGRALKQGIPEGFQQRVAANAVALVQREAALAGRISASEVDRLAGLLGRQGALEDLNRSLCEQIECQAASLDQDRLIGHLIRSAIDKMTVDQPSYPAFAALACS
ncbi:MAG: DUF6285 domain-containing protein [Hyphomonas sp.]